MDNFFETLSKAFSSDKAYWRMFGRLFDILALSVLWFVCSIPIVTIGAATTAMNCVMMKIANGEEPPKAKTFFHSFKVNFKEATIVWLSMLALGLVLAADLTLSYRFAVDGGSAFMTYFIPVMASVAFVWLMTLIWIFPYIAKFTDTLKVVFINSLRLSFRHFGWTMLIVLLDASVMLLALHYVSALLVIMPGLLSLMNSRVLARQFLRYIDPEEFAARKGKGRRDRAEKQKEKMLRREIE